MKAPRHPGEEVGACWRVSARRVLSLDLPRVMAILNVTPDSFSDGGTLASVEQAVAAAELAVREGADVLDVGGESTRPGAARVSASQQIERVVPVVRAIRARLPEACISVDTTLSAVASAALDAGADAINDVSAGLEDVEMLPLAAARGAGLVLMHRLKSPAEDSYSDQYEAKPNYQNVVEVVREFLRTRAAAARAAGIAAESIVLDPGLGFGKSVDQNLELIRATRRFFELGFPVLSAASRKSFVGRISLARDSQPSERLAGSVAISVAHYLAGARIFRVHDVRPHVEALRAISAVTPPNMPQTA